MSTRHSFLLHFIDSYLVEVTTNFQNMLTLGIKNLRVMINKMMSVGCYAEGTAIQIEFHS